MGPYTMTAARNRVATAPPARVAIEAEFGWRSFDRGAATLWIKGYLNGGGFDGAAFGARADGLIAAIAAGDEAEIGRILTSLDGHFALCIVTPNAVLAAVDRVRSIPLACGRDGDGWVIDDQALRLRDRLGLGVDDIDPDAALAFAMSGYTIGSATLYKGIRQLLPGEFLLHGVDDTAPTARRYALYRPWHTEPRDRDHLLRELTEVTLGILEKLVQSADGRQILAPLSAGLDSRLIVSGLAHLGYRNVQCFSYGHRNNFEAAAAEKIAAHLGYPWRFVPFTHRYARKAFASDQHRHYHNFADSCAAVPVEHDFLALRRMQGASKGVDWVADDAIIVNGQSGDYITGAHIPPSLARLLPSATREERDATIFDALVAKHYGLWPSLQTPEVLARIKSLLWIEMEAAGAPLDDPAMSFALYEFSEFQNRQCKYVVAGQSAYDFFGYDWRLPLWDNDYLDFWEKVPLADKLDRNLFREMLERENWGGVWRDWPAPRYLTPKWILPLRYGAKLACAPLGTQRWHAVERRVFTYWMDFISNYDIVRYRNVLFAPRDHRNGQSWLARSYLDNKGLAFDGGRLNSPQKT